MVGAPPESGRTTVIRAPIIPVTVQLLGPDGKVATLNGVPLILTVTRDIHNVCSKPTDFPAPVLHFRNRPTQRPAHARGILGSCSPRRRRQRLAYAPGPHNKKTRVTQIPSGSWFFAPNADGSCCAFALVDSTIFSNLLFPPTAAPDNSTPIGAAENAGVMTTRDLTTLLFNNVYLYNGTPDQCCTLGFHSYDIEPDDVHNGNRERRFVMDYSSWISNGLFFFGFEDVAAISHEIAETFNHPFVDNATPWWQSVDPFRGSARITSKPGMSSKCLLATPSFQFR